MLRQKNINFEVIRENANLKSQLESLQSGIEGLKLGTINEIPPKASIDIASKSINEETRGNNEAAITSDDNRTLELQALRETKDENSQLKAELTKCR